MTRFYHVARDHEGNLTVVHSHMIIPSFGGDGATPMDAMDSYINKQARECELLMAERDKLDAEQAKADALLEELIRARRRLMDEKPDDD